MENVIKKNDGDVIQTTLLEQMSRELTVSEIEEVSGGRWIDYTDNGSSCDGRIWVS